MKNKNLGKTAVDDVTGFKGIVTGFSQYLTGCDQYLLTPFCVENNKYPEAQWFDINRLKFEQKKKIKIDTSEDKGPDMPAPLY